MNKFLLAFIILVMMSVRGNGQSNNDPSMDYQGTLCAGQSIYIYLKGGSNCAGMSVSGSSSWSFSEPPSSVSYNGNYTACSATWSNGGVKYVNVSYNCISGGGSTGINLPFDPKPSIQAEVVPEYIGKTPCAGIDYVFLNVKNPTNTGSSPTYQYFVDGASVYVGGALSYKYFPSGGAHSFYISVTSSGGNCSSVVNSNTVGFSANTPLSYTAHVYGPQSFCASSNPTYDASYYVDISTTYTTPTYNWYVNSAHVENNNFNQLHRTLNQGTDVYCIVSQNTDASHTCLLTSATSNTFHTDITPLVTPTVQIQSEKFKYCTGELMSFSTAGQYLYGSPSYSWFLDGQYFSSSPTPTLSATGARNSTLSVDISNIGGACLTSNEASASQLISINKTPVLDASLGVSLCTGKTFDFTPTSDVSNALFNWTQASGNVSGASNGTGSSISQTLVVNNGVASGYVDYTITPYANYNTPLSETYTCTGASIVKYVTVNANPSLPILVSGSTFNICGAGKIPLTAQPALDGTDVYWYDNTGTFIGSGNKVKPYISVNSIFQASTYNSQTQCESSKIQVNALIKNMYTASLNSVITLEPLVDGFTPISNLTTRSPDSVSQKVQYFDGLGRHYQDVFVRNSPNKNDITQTSIYDAFGRDVQEYLPFTGGNNGCPKNDIIDVNGDYIGLAQDFYNNPSSKIAVDDKPYATTIYESSPLSRVLKKGAPGAVWQPLEGDAYSTNDKTLKRSYKTNTSADHVLYFKYDATSGKVIMPGTGTYYDDNQLGVTRTLDEHNNEVIEYVDLEGHMVCKKVQYGTDNSSNALYASTYYIYDDFGSLVVVLPPEGVKAIVPSSN